MRPRRTLCEHEVPAVRTPLAIRILVVGVMVLITSYALPESQFFLSQLNQKYLKPVSMRALFATGLWQHWSMYVEYNYFWTETTWEIGRELQDGTLENLNWPMLRRLSRWDAFLTHKHRKYVETANQGYLSGRLPQRACYFYARIANPGEKVVLIKEVRKILDPQTGTAVSERSVLVSCARPDMEDRF